MVVWMRALPIRFAVTAEFVYIWDIQDRLEEYISKWNTCGSYNEL